jgi:hypothetical protein
MKKKTKLILEFTEFNAQRLNPDSAQMGIAVDNPQLSINAFDKHEDAIRSGISKINSIIHSLANSSGYRSLKSKLALENQKIQSMKIQRIIKSNEVDYNVYFSFVIDDEEYYGVLKNIFDRNPYIQSEVFKDVDLIQTKEWIIRTRGLLLKAIRIWLRPEKGVYTLLNERVYCYSQNTGNIIEIKKGEEVEVINSSDRKIIINYDGEQYSLINDNFIYFNWWFEKTT